MATAAAAVVPAGAVEVPTMAGPIVPGVESFAIDATNGLTTTGGTFTVVGDKLMQTPFAANASTPDDATALPKDALVQLTSGEVGPNQKVFYGQTDANGALKSVTTDKTAAAAMYRKSLPDSVLNDAFQRATAAKVMEDSFGIKAEDGFALMKDEAAVRLTTAQARQAEAGADWADFQVTKGKWELGMQVGGMVAALWEKGLQTAYLTHKIGMEDKLAQLAADKETNQHELQMTVLDKETKLKNSSMRYDYKRAKLEASTEKYKSKLAADVKKAKIKRDSVRDLFFPRNNYYYGNAYA